MPVMEVEIVIAGVVVGFATVPANPLAVTTETEDTPPPPPPPASCQLEPFHSYKSPVSRATLTSPLRLLTVGNAAALATGAFHWKLPKPGRFTN